MSALSTKNRFASLIGNLLEHYDTALFAFLAPFIAPLFFPEKDPVTALILTYAMIPLGLLTKPLGSLFFGRLGDAKGRKKALFYSLLGTAIVSISMGLLPTYSSIGKLAPAFLALGKMLQSFFAAGESVGGALVLLEGTHKEKRSLFSSFYDISTIGGILIASFAVSFISHQSETSLGWRALFFSGGLTAILGVFLRRDGKEDVNNIQEKPRSSLLTILLSNKRAFISIILASGFTHVTYCLAFPFMNGFIPLITSLPKTAMVALNTKLLIADMLLLPFFGYIAYKWGKEKIMLAASLSATALALPLFSLLPEASLQTVIFIRICIIIMGVAFGAPYYAWAIDQVPTKHRYLILAFGSALGSQLIGAPTSAACLWLYKATSSPLMPSLYLMTSGACASLAVYYLKLKKYKSLSILP